MCYKSVIHCYLHAKHLHITHSLVDSHTRLNYYERNTMDPTFQQNLTVSPSSDREKKLDDMQLTITKTKRFLASLYIQEKYAHDRSIT